MNKAKQVASLLYGEANPGIVFAIKVALGTLHHTADQHDKTAVNATCTTSYTITAIMVHGRNAHK